MNSDTFKFNSTMNILGAMPNFSQDIVKNEPMFFNASVNFAKRFGGPITREFIKQIIGKIPKGIDYNSLVIDSRVHMLMKGWYPAIPGWHHDDVPRDTSDGQPNYHNPSYHSRHIMGLVNGDICPTQFALGECELPEAESGEVVYRKWHPMVDALCESGQMNRVDVPGNGIIEFDAHSFHQAQMAKDSGWRWFARVSWNTDRIANVTNETRKQVQVYIPAPDYRGW